MSIGIPETALQIALLEDRVRALQTRILDLVDESIWSRTAISAAMQILEAPNCYGALTLVQRRAVERIRAGLNDMSKENAMPRTDC